MHQSVYHLGLIGWPLEKSLSPLIHDAALRGSKLSGDYQLFPIPTEPDPGVKIRMLLDEIRRGSLDGLNVTIPYKQKIVPFLDGVTGSANNIGAVNTVFRKDETLVGDNTDAPGFLASLASLKILDRLSSGGVVLVLGAGGAARAVVYALANEGYHVFVAARSIAQAVELVKNIVQRQSTMRRLNIHPVLLHTGMMANLPAPELIVNTTSAGMAPDTENTPWPESEPFPPGVIVYDLVYKPLETRFMKQASISSSAVYNGLGMLVQQALFSFERWTGVHPDPQIIYRALMQAGVIDIIPEI